MGLKIFVLESLFFARSAERCRGMSRKGAHSRAATKERRFPPLGRLAASNPRRVWTKSPSGARSGYSQSARLHLCPFRKFRLPHTTHCALHPLASWFLCLRSRTVCHVKLRGSEPDALN